MKVSTPFIGTKHFLLSIFGYSPRIRYESRHALLSAIANYFGFRLYNSNLIWPTDAEYLDHWRCFPAHERDRIHERRFHLYYLAKSRRNLEGDTAECGVLNGAGSYLIMKATATDLRTHYIFDSFEGLSTPGASDLVSKQHTFQWQTGDLQVSEDIVSKNLAGFGNFTMYRGWIPSRFNGIEEKKFSFVHIDVDLYQPTYDSLAFFYSRMTPGGFIVCDDYGSDACPGAFKACNEFMADKPEEIIHLTTGQGLIIKL